MKILRKIFGFVKAWMHYNAKQRGRRTARAFIPKHPTMRCPRCNSDCVQEEAGQYVCYNCGIEFTAEQAAKAKVEREKAEAARQRKK